MSLDELIRLNSKFKDMIHPNDVLRLEPDKNKYICNVNKYSRNFDMYETRTYNKY